MTLKITRSAVEKRNIAGALEYLLTLTDSAENVYRFRGALRIRVEGYEHDAREPYRIPELRAFMRALTAEWPHWLWYLKRGEDHMLFLFSCLCEVQVTPGPDGDEACFADQEEFVAVLNDLLERTQALYEAYGISESEAAQTADLAVQDLFGK